MNAYLEILRINEWYKNITVLLGIIFALFLSKTAIYSNDFSLIIVILVLSCLISSANYILNAITDMDYDGKHPFKKFRPLPSKKITKDIAIIIMLLILVISLYISLSIFNSNVTMALLSLFLAAIIYNVKPIRLKDIPYIDVLSESINNPIRFMIGWFIFSNNFPSFWFLLLVWFLACILMTKKRYEELKKYPNSYRSSMKYYTSFSLKFMIFLYSIFSITSIIILFKGYTIL